jgi:hypothetical protein
VTDESVKEDVRRRVERRIAELEPLVQEYEELRRIVAAIDGEAAERGSGQAPPRRRLTPSGPGAGGHSARGEDALARIAAQPGVAVGELAAQMGIGTTYLYRLLPRLEREGRLRKEGKGYHLA